MIMYHVIANWVNIIVIICHKIYTMISTVGVLFLCYCIWFRMIIYSAMNIQYIYIYIYIYLEDTSRHILYRSHIGSRPRADMKPQAWYAVRYKICRDIFSLSHLSACCTTFVSHSTSLSSSVIGQLKRSHDTQGTNLSISDVQKTLYQSDITHIMR